jgi:hypothetical protein
VLDTNVSRGEVTSVELVSPGKVISLEGVGSVVLGEDVLLGEDALVEDPPLGGVVPLGEVCIGELDPLGEVGV